MADPPVEPSPVPSSIAGDSRKLHQELDPLALVTTTMNDPIHQLWMWINDYLNQAVTTTPVHIISHINLHIFVRAPTTLAAASGRMGLRRCLAKPLHLISVQLLDVFCGHVVDVEMVSLADCHWGLLSRLMMVVYGLKNGVLES